MIIFEIAFRDTSELTLLKVCWSLTSCCKSVCVCVCTHVTSAGNYVCDSTNLSAQHASVAASLAVRQQTDKHGKDKVVEEDHVSHITVCPPSV